MPLQNRGFGLHRPGSPWQNGYIESFNARLRDELLSCEMFDTLTDAKVLLEDWRIDYNWNWAHSALGNQPPQQLYRPAPPQTANKNSKPKQAA